MFRRCDKLVAPPLDGFPLLLMCPKYRKELYYGDNF